MITSPVVEVLGTVQPDLSVQEMTLTNFSDNFDLGAYEKLLQCASGKDTNGAVFPR
jgi:hypothetical protein